MRNHFAVGLLGVFILMLSLVLTGCNQNGKGQFFSQPGKTAKEGKRDQIRTLNVNNQELMQDLNRTFLIDKPSKLNQMSIP